MDGFVGTDLIGKTIKVGPVVNHGKLNLYTNNIERRDKSMRYVMSEGRKYYILADVAKRHGTSSQYIKKMVPSYCKTVETMRAGKKLAISVDGYEEFLKISRQREEKEIAEKERKMKKAAKKVQTAENTNVMVFDNQEFGKVRTVVINGEPYFVGKDVAEVLGYSDTDQAIRKHIDMEDKLTRRINGAGQMREVTIINESGLYSLILSSKLPTAKQFKHWVTSEVLPAIRKTGKYDKTAIPIGCPNFRDPVLMARLWADDQDKIAELAPKAKYYDMVGKTEGLLTMGELANEIQHKIGKPFGRSTLCKCLRENHIFCSERTKDGRYFLNRPRSEYVAFFKTVATEDHQATCKKTMGWDKETTNKYDGHPCATPEGVRWCFDHIEMFSKFA